VLLPVDLALLGFNAVLVVVWWPLLATEPTARWVVGAHLAATGLPLVLLAIPRTRHAGVAGLRELYPLVWLGLFWAELGMHYRFVHTAPNDVLIAGLEQAMFGIQPSIVWRQTLPLPWLAQLMYAAYLAYYLILAGVPLAIIALRGRRAVRSLVLRLSLTYLGCFLVYATFPVVGPLHFFERHAGSGGLEALEGAIRGAGDALGTAFPSSHVAGSVTLAWLAWRWGPPAAGLVCGGLAAIIAAAVVYTGNHFVVDSLGGGAVAALVLAVVAPALERLVGVIGFGERALRPSGAETLAT